MARTRRRRSFSHNNISIRSFGRGSILLEVLLAVLILSIAMVTIIGNFVQSSALASETGYHLRLSMLLETKLEEFFSQDVIYEKTERGNFPEPYENCSYEVRIIEEDRRYRHNEFPGDLPELLPMYRIELKISVPVGNRTYDFETHTYYNHLDFQDQPPYMLRFRLDED